MAGVKNRRFEVTEENPDGVPENKEWCSAGVTDKETGIVRQCRGWRLFGDKEMGMFCASHWRTRKYMKVSRR